MKAYGKNFLRQITGAPGRFLSLLFIAALGVYVYAGVSFASPDMRKTAVEYFNDQNLSDLHIMSATGFDDGDIDAIEEATGPDCTVEPIYTADVFVHNDSGPFIAKVYSLQESLNMIIVAEGRLPKISGECITDYSTLSASGKKIGDTISMFDNTVEDHLFPLKAREYTITGICASPLYITAEKGNTSKGSGAVTGYMYIPAEDFAYPVYTDVYVRENGRKDYFSDGYDDGVRALTEKIKAAERLRAEEKGYGKWYINNNSVNAGYSGFEQDTKRLAAIAAVFPIIFFLVAALVGLTSMARMVEEHRNEIGIYKSLGYSKTAITWKYAGYALITAIAGSFAGFFAGRFTLPAIIFNAYAALYRLPDIKYSYDPTFFILSVAASIVCLAGAALATGIGELIAVPAELLRPKTPAKGQRVFLERLTFIWKRMNFTAKVTARNLIRYKQRFFMTVIGIAGCAALLITGFGLRNSINDMAILQFEDIYGFDALILFQEGSGDIKDSVLYDKILNEENITGFTMSRQSAMSAYDSNGGKFMDIHLFVPDNVSEIGEYISLRERKSGKALAIGDEGVIITEKLSYYLNLKKGDDILLKDSDNNEYTAKISGITEHYISHYIYLSPALYEKIFDTGYAPNNFIVKMNGTDNESRAKMSENILDGDSSVLYINYTETAKHQIGDMVNVMDFVIYVLIISAGGLAFTVLVNLTNINIAERIREIATIRVLGFHVGETASYIYRENAVLTAFGIAAGCVLGYFLHMFVVVTAEVKPAMFARAIHPASYVLSVIITVVFSLIVNAAMFYRFRKIDMVESLKGAE